MATNETQCQMLCHAVTPRDKRDISPSARVVSRVASTFVFDFQTMVVGTATIAAGSWLVVLAKLCAW